MDSIITIELNRWTEGTVIREREKKNYYCFCNRNTICFQHKVTKYYIILLIKNTIYSHTTVYTYSLSINFFSDISIISRVDRSGPYKMNRRTLVTLS